MVKPWTQEVGDARSVIEPIVREIDGSVDVSFDYGLGYANVVLELALMSSGPSARCAVTFEAWSNARSHPQELREALTRIIEELGTNQSSRSYFITSRGLTRESSETPSEHLRTLAAAQEADVLAERMRHRAKA